MNRRELDAILSCAILPPSFKKKVRHFANLSYRLSLDGLFFSTPFRLIFGPFLLMGLFIGTTLLLSSFGITAADEPASYWTGCALVLVPASWFVVRWGAQTLNRWVAERSNLVDERDRVGEEMTQELLELSRSEEWSEGAALFAQSIGVKNGAS